MKQMNLESNSLFSTVDKASQSVKVIRSLSLVFHMYDFSYLCKMQYPLNLVLENWENLMFN